MISLRSAITKKLLNYFFINPEESLYVNELARKLGLDKRNLVKKAKELETEGILKSHARGNLKLYSIDKNYSFYHEFKKIFLRTVGLEANLKKIITETTGVKQAYIYGSYAQNNLDTHSDIDILVVGDYSMAELQGKLSRLQKEIDREINTVNLDESEYKKRLKDKGSFIAGILKRKHIKLI
jgi:uncharacterized protein